MLARYAKTYPFTLAGEHTHYTAGDGPVVFDWAGLRVAPMVCYDLRFPEVWHWDARQSLLRCLCSTTAELQRWGLMCW